MAFKSTMDGKAIRAILKKHPFIAISMRAEVKGIVYGTQVKLSRNEFAKKSLGGHELDLRQAINKFVRRNTKQTRPMQTDRQFTYCGKDHGER